MTEFDRAIALWDMSVTLAYAYLLTKVYIESKKYKNGYMKVRKILMLTFTGLLIVNIMALFYDCDFFEMTSLAREAFAIGRGMSAAGFIYIMFQRIPKHTEE